MKLRIAGFVSLALFGAAFSASAADTSSSFQSTSSVVESCSMSKDSDMTFGAYDPVVANATQRLNSVTPARMIIRCTVGTKFKIFYDQGLHPSADSTCATPRRAMKSTTGDDVLAYTISGLDKDTCNVDQVPVFTWTPALGGNTLQSAVSGRIAGGQEVRPGEYSDTIIGSVVF